MMFARTLLATCVAATLAACGATNPPPSPALVDQHVARATDLAGQDLAYLLGVCRPQPAERPAQGHAADEGIERLINQPPPAPGKAFDNLYFVGSTWVSAWVLQTSQGLVLIDALNNAKEAGTLIEGGMRKLGLDPAQIKYILVTHGHGDHYGGVQMLAQKYGARVIASQADWDMMGGKLEFASRVWDAPPKRDMVVADGQTMTLGDTSITFYITPGHTLGTISPVFDVRDNGQRHKAMLWGGTSFNFGRDLGRLDSYIAQTERMAVIAKQQGVDIPLSNHPTYDGTVAKMKAHTANPSAPNPFVMGTDTVVRGMRVMGECARAQKTRFLVS